jgi:integrase
MIDPHVEPVAFAHGPERRSVEVHQLVRDLNGNLLADKMEEGDGECYYDGEVVTRFGFHNLRHGLATWLAEQGTDPMVIQRMLRHSSKDMTMHYIHRKAREAQEKYISELGIVPDEPCGSDVRVQ